jgi:hypothetical protein
VRALNDFDILTYYMIALEFTYEELCARRPNSFASSRRNMSYYAASQAMGIRGGGNQVKWHPGLLVFFSGVHGDPRDAAGNEIPENMSADMIAAWESEPAPEQAVLIEFAASLHTVTGIPFGDKSVMEGDAWSPFTFVDRAAEAAAKGKGRRAGAAIEEAGAPKKARK